MNSHTDIKFWMKNSDEWRELWKRSSENVDRLLKLVDEWQSEYQKSTVAGDAMAAAIDRWLAIDERLAREGSSASIDEEWDNAKFALDDAVRAWRSR